MNIVDNIVNNPQQVTDTTQDSNNLFYGNEAITGNEGDANQVDKVDVVTTNSGEILEVGTQGANTNLEGGDPSQAEGDTNKAPNATGEQSDNPNDHSKESPADTQGDTADKALEALGKDLISKGVDFLGAVNEYQETGGISEKTLQAIEKAGYPREVIEGFVEARRAIDERNTQDIYSYVGGESEFREIQTWMKGNLSKAEIDAYNQAVNEDNFSAVKMMLDGIQAKRVAKQGTRKPTLLGTTPSKPSSASQGFTSKEEMVKAMSDPRYGIDRGYTLGVERRMMYTQGIF